MSTNCRRKLDKDRRGIYFKQAAYGVPVRMALLKFLLTGAIERSRRRDEEWPTVPTKALKRSARKCHNANCITSKEPVSTQQRFRIYFADR